MEYLSTQLFEVFSHSQAGPGKKRCGDAIKVHYLKEKGWILLALADGVSAYPCDWKASEVSCSVAINSLIRASLKNQPIFKSVKI